MAASCRNCRLLLPAYIFFNSTWC